MTSEAVLMPNWIGDLLLALSVVERKKNAEKCALSLIVPERLSGLTKLLCSLPVIPCRRTTVRDFFNSIDTVKSASFSRLYLLPHSFSSALFAFLCGIPYRRGVSADMRGFLLSERLPPAAAARSRHLTYEYSEVLETPYSDPSSWKGLPINISGEHAGSIVFCPGAAYGPAKRWPHFQELAHIFSNRKIVILGDAEDRSDAEQIAEALPDHVTNYAGATSLETAAAIIAGASVLISNDSGLLHLAGFLGTPCVGIYGSTSPAWTRPLGHAVRIAAGSCLRSPCFERTCPIGDYHCLLNIKPETVALCAQEIMRCS